MRNQRIYTLDQYAYAGSYDLIELLGPSGCTNMIVQKRTLDILVTSLFITGQNVHLSGPSGCGKTTLIQCLTQVQENLPMLCRAYGIPECRIDCFSFPVAALDSSSELYRLRSISPEKGTYFEDSELWNWFTDIEESTPEMSTVVIGWIRELGRAQHPTIQNALVDIITDGPLQHPDGRRYLQSGKRITWVTDSNYAAGTSGLCPPDPALMRRFPVQCTLAPFPPYIEKTVIQHLLANEDVPLEEHNVDSLLKLGKRIRELQEDGHMNAVGPGIPTYLGILRLAASMPTMEFQDLLMFTLLGNCRDDHERLPLLLEEVFGKNRLKRPALPLGDNLL